MPNRLELPQELDALIEKREQDERRSDAAAEVDEDRRSGEDRRKAGDQAAEESPS